jgi:hypothetical protein
MHLFKLGIPCSRSKFGGSGENEPLGGFCKHLDLKRHLLARTQKSYSDKFSCWFLWPVCSICNLAVFPLMQKWGKSRSSWNDAKLRCNFRGYHYFVLVVILWPEAGKLPLRIREKPNAGLRSMNDQQRADPDRTAAWHVIETTITEMH